MLTVVEMIETKQYIFFSLQEKDKKEDESNEFVSAVCWKPVSALIRKYNIYLTVTEEIVSTSCHLEHIIMRIVDLCIYLPQFDWHKLVNHECTNQL